MPIFNLRIGVALLLSSVNPRVEAPHCSRAVAHFSVLPSPQIQGWPNTNAKRSEELLSQMARHAAVVMMVGLTGLFRWQCRAETV